MKNVDIIVPIYNAYEYTYDCIKTVIEHTDLHKHQLVLINDKSPDDRIFPMLKEYKAKNNELNIIVMENEENLGFVKTVNKGMSYSKNDVVLLNSDTEVTKNWLDKIISCAYSNELIATVTPFTNNGTNCSIPNFGIDNELPQNMSLAEYANLIENCSIKIYPELTTANGFCMYIKRTVLDEIGYFDDETFGKGYGEENDFCYRALDYGYKHVLCDDTFVYHKGTQSFTKENLTQAKEMLINEHMKILRDRYPQYTMETDRFMMLNPLKDIHRNIKLNIELYNKKKILYIIHEWDNDFSNIIGGTSLHLKDVIDGIKNEMACFVLAPDKYDLTRYKLYLYNGQNIKDQIGEFKINTGYGITKYTSNDYKIMLKNILISYGINVVHVHHLMHQTFDIANLVKELNIYSIITLHDFYMICPTVNLLYKEEYCNNLNEKNCVKCLKEKTGLNNDILKNRRKIINELLLKFDRIIVPSENTKKIYLEVYDNLNIEVIEHGVNAIQNKNKYVRKKDEINIAFIGAMTLHKGSGIFKDLINNNKNSNIKIHLFGKNFDRILEKNKNQFINHGKYVREELPNLLQQNNIDLICIFSIWPETYSYTLTEACISGIPVLTHDIGAVAERVKANNWGWVVDYKLNANGILSKIKEIFNNKEEYEKIKTNINNFKLKTINEMCLEYLNIYNQDNSLNKMVDIYSILNYEAKNKLHEFEDYRNTYGHLVHKYECLRRTKVWRFLKKLKSKM